MNKSSKQTPPRRKRRTAVVFHRHQLVRERRVQRLLKASGWKVTGEVTATGYERGDVRLLVLRWPEGNLSQLYSILDRPSRFADWGPDTIEVLK